MVMGMDWNQKLIDDLLNKIEFEDDHIKHTFEKILKLSDTKFWISPNHIQYRCQIIDNSINQNKMIYHFIGRSIHTLLKLKENNEINLDCVVLKCENEQMSHFWNFNLNMFSKFRNIDFGDFVKYEITTKPFNYYNNCLTIFLNPTSSQSDVNYNKLLYYYGEQ